NETLELELIVVDDCSTDASLPIARVARGEDRPPLVQNEDPLRESDRALRTGDEHTIAQEMRAIDAIGVRHGVGSRSSCRPSTKRIGTTVSSIGSSTAHSHLSLM